MKIGVLGSGQVGQVLANGLLAAGHSVKRGSRDPSKLQGWVNGAEGDASVGTFEETASYGELLVLAVKGAAAEAAVDAAGLANLKNKTVLDATNPIEESPPEEGVLAFFTGPNESLMERLQARAPEARFVKCFSCVGNALMVKPKLTGGPPTMFICGNDEDAKMQAQEILTTFGWGWLDLGKAQAARAIEPLCQLWCIPGFRDGSWTHAFKVIRP